MPNIAVLGSSDTVMGFKALGLEVYPVNTPDEAKSSFRSITKSGEYTIIYVEENYADVLDQDISRYKDSATPAIILIPGKNGSLGLGLTALNDAVIRAVGTDVL